MRNLLILLIVGGLGSFAHAASVMTVKDKKVLLEIGGMEDTLVGDEFVLVDLEGKRKGLVKVKQVKGHRAIAELLKGSADEGYTLLRRKSEGSRLSRAVRPDENEISSDSTFAKLSRYTGESMGVLGSLVNTSMSVDVRGGSGVTARTTGASLKGTSFGVLGYYDHPFLKEFHFRGMGGLEQVQGSGSIGTPDCGGSTSCDFSVMYLSAYGLAKFNYLMTDMKAWVGGGLGFLIALSKSSSVLDTSQISTNQIYQIATGVDIPIGKSGAYVPIVLDYGIFPASDTVRANMITLRAGYAWPP